MTNMNQMAPEIQAQGNIGEKVFIFYLCIVWSCKSLVLQVTKEITSSNMGS